jgi:hypothetical protein
MDRTLVDPFEIPLETDILHINVDAMVAVGGLLQMLVGSSTVLVGLGATPVTPVGLKVTIAPGSIVQMGQVDPVNSYSTLGTNSNACMKMGMLYAPQSLAITPPATAGYSQCYLIQAQFSEADGDPVVMPYVNPANPAQALAGPGGNGVPQNYRRTQACVLSLVAGAAAPTGAQRVPATTPGCVPMYVVTVANGQTVIVTANIALAPGSPFLEANMLSVRQRLSGNLTLYVSAGVLGSDANNGLSPQSPFATLQAAADYANNDFDTYGNNISVSVADGTYAAGVSVSRALVGGGTLEFVGDTANPAACAINASNASCFTVVAGNLTVSGFKCTATGSVAGQGSAIVASGAGILNFSFMNFGACTQFHIYASSGGNVTANNITYTISGNASGHIVTGQGFVNILTATVSIPAAVAFTYFAESAVQGALQTLAMTFTGTGVAGTTGQRYTASLDSVITTNGGGANYFPGSTAGALATGGQYA